MSSVANNSVLSLRTVLPVLLLFAYLPLDAVQPNILLITIDTLRADHLRCYGYKQATSPNLDRLARDAVLFQNVFSAVPMTLPSHATILNGLYPQQHGIRDNAHFHLTDRPFLQQILKKHGYNTAAFVSGATLSSSFGLNRGFDFYDDEFTGTERKANETTIRALEWLKKARAPYFLWVHYFDPHAEYEPPEKFRKQFPSPYDGEIAFVDSELPKLWTAVGSGAIVLVTADHGESLGEHGETTHSVFLYDATLKVPLILRSPGMKPGVRKDAVSLADIAPTILELVGFAAETGPRDGVSLFARQTPRTLIAESLYAQRNFGYAPLYASVQKGKKYIQAPQPEFYDLLADPSEQHNLVKTSKINDWKMALQTYATTRRRDDATTQQRDDATTQRRNNALSPEEAEKLRSLGYVSASVPKNDADPKAKIQVIEGFRQGMIFLKTEQYDQAEKRFREISTTEKQNGLAFRYLADALSAQQKYADAARAYTASLERLADPEVTVQLAKAYNRLGQSAEAEKILQETVKRFPNYFPATFELASYYAAQKKWDSAFGLLKKDSPDFSNQRGILLLQKKEFLPAIAEFEKALRLQQRAAYWNNLGIAYQQFGQLKQGEDAYLRGLKLNPDYEECEANLAFLLVQQKRWNEANLHLERITSRNQKLWRARFALGFVRENQQKPQEALEIYRKLLSDAPSNWPERSQVEGRIRQLAQ